MAYTIDLSERVALVTGGSRGIGAAVAKMLAEARAAVVIGCTSESKTAIGLRNRLRGMGVPAELVAGDLSKPETARAYIDFVREQFGQLDILVNNAGVWKGDPIDELRPELLTEVMNVNLMSVFDLCRDAVPLLRESSQARIVNISSTASLMGEPSYSPYAASKAGLDGLTRSLAVELGPFGITVNSVAPGWTETDMTTEELKTEAGKALIESIPLKKVATPEDVANAVLFCASKMAGHISGVTIPVEGAYRIRR